MSDSAEKLLRMADQIVRHLPPGEKRVDQAADHLRKFWTPKMRADLVAAVKDRDIDPVLVAVLSKL